MALTQYLTLGRSGLAISPLVFGGNVFGWTADEKTSFSLLDAFVDAGLNAVDTADVYSAWAEGNHGGESETIIGNWLRRNPGKRSGIVLITKVGSKLGPDKKGLSARRITEAVEELPNRIGIDTGAFMSGRLTALGLEGTRRWYLVARDATARAEDEAAGRDAA